MVSSGCSCGTAVFRVVSVAWRALVVRALTSDKAALSRIAEVGWIFCIVNNSFAALRV